jgi:hypothetical protein
MQLVAGLERHEHQKSEQPQILGRIAKVHRRTGELRCGAEAGAPGIAILARASQADHFQSRAICGHFVAPQDCHEQTGSSIIIVGTSTECLMGLRHRALGITGN